MQRSEDCKALNLYKNAFSHVYVEDAIWEHPRCQKILERLPGAEVVHIHHYKDVFNRLHQDAALQHESRALILAAREGNRVFRGAPVCQDFGSDSFYYTSCMMNCVFDCEYCFLKGMYPTGNLTLFLNLEDYFSDVEKLLEEGPLYLSVSFDTDLLAVESLTGYVSEWVSSAKDHPGLTMEVRTKSAGTKWYADLPKTEQAVFAYTLSPDEVISAYEHGTASLKGRLSAAKAAMDAGFPIRLCFDPMIHIPDWEAAYAGMLKETFAVLDPTEIRDCSVGSFRISGDYLKNMRKRNMGSAVVQYPYERTDGYYHYPKELVSEMETMLVQKLLEYGLPEEKIFRWETEERT